MIKLITYNWLKARESNYNQIPCIKRLMYGYFDTGPVKRIPIEKLINKLIQSEHTKQANRIITKILGSEDNIRYTIFCAEQTANFVGDKEIIKLSIKAIKSVKEYLENQSKETKKDLKNKAYAVKFLPARAAIIAASSPISCTGAIAEGAYHIAVNTLKYYNKDEYRNTVKNLKNKIVKYGIKLIMEE